MLELFKNKKRITVTKDMSVSYLLRQDKEIRAILEDAGMHCVGCPSAMDETIEMACLVHGADPAALMERIQLVLDRKYDAEHAEDEDRA